MFPGMNPKQMQQAMKQLGIKQEDLPAKEVVIRMRDGQEILITNPSVQKMIIQGQASFQVSGTVVEKEIDNTPDINEEDIEMVILQTNCSREEAKAAIEICEGDLAQAIIELNNAKE